MKNPLVILSVVVGLVVFGFGIQLIRIGFMASDFKKVMNPSDNPGFTRPEKLDLPGIMTDFDIPTGIKSIDWTKVPSLFGRSTKKPLLSKEDNAKLLEGISQEDKANLKKGMLKHVLKNIKKLPSKTELMAIPEIIDLRSSIHDFRRIRDISRYWYIVGNLFADEGDFNTALSCFAGIMVVAHDIETSDDEGSLPLITRMIAIALRKMASLGVLEAAPKLDLPFKKIKVWIKLFSKLEKNMVSMERCITAESRVIPSLYTPKNLPSGSMMAEVMRDKSLHEKYVAAFYEPSIKACNMPFEKALKVLQERRDAIEKLQTKIFTKTSPLKYFFTPQDYVVQLLMTMTCPNLYRAMQSDYVCRQSVRAAIVVLAIAAYKAKLNVEPESLEEVEKLLNLKLPLDLYSNKPFVYKNAGSKRLFSVGEDMKAETKDDMVFMPLE